MDESDATSNPLVSIGRAPDTALQVQLHPLVLLTISDYLTRHTIRRHDTPVIGVILGQQNGRDITMEHAFECKASIEKGCILMDVDWFTERLEEYREVHKAPALDLVGGFALGPATGPLPEHVPVTQQLLNVNDPATLLLFHPSSVAENASAGGKLPLSIYEAFYERGSENEDKSTQLEKLGMGRQLKLKYQELDYSMDTGEAEMIGMDFVARGAGNATAVSSTTQVKPAAVADVGKGKGKAVAENTDEEDPDTLLSPEDEELIAQLTAKANAIKMLHQRINLIKTYLISIPPSYLSDANIPISSTALTDPRNPSQPPINHSILRSVQALVGRLSLLIPADREAFALESSQQKSDVALVELLGSMTQTLQDAREMGKKFAVVDSFRNQGRKGASASSMPFYNHGREAQTAIPFGRDPKACLLASSLLSVLTVTENENGVGNIREGFLSDTTSGFAYDHNDKILRDGMTEELQKKLKAQSTHTRR
ncbi:MAG: hypothetical protein Q9165_007583 [Trypethelium subeluteriae]